MLYDSRYCIVRRHNKTELEVPDDRLCNALLLCDMFDSDNVHLLARKG
jgi:hypothetical protein